MKIYYRKEQIKYQTKNGNPFLLERIINYPGWVPSLDIITGYELINKWDYKQYNNWEITYLDHIGIKNYRLWKLNHLKNLN